MAIFPKKEICPICGRPIKGDVRLKIKDNVELCRTCSSQIWMDSSMIPNQTVEDMKQHLAYRQENREKMERFQISWGAEAGAYVLRADKEMQLWYCTSDRSDRNPPLFEFEALKSAVYLEDGEPAEEIQTGLKSLFGEKEAPKLVQSMKIEIEVDNPYVHKIVVETVGPGRGMTTGTMQYRMNRKSIQTMMNVLLSIQRYAAGETDDLPAEGQEQSDVSDPQMTQETYAAPAPEQTQDDLSAIPGTDQDQ